MTLTTASAGLIGFELARNPPDFLASYLASESEGEGRVDNTPQASTIDQAFPLLPSHGITKSFANPIAPIASTKRVLLAHLFDRVTFWESSSQEAVVSDGTDSTRLALKPAGSEEHIERLLFDKNYPARLHENAIGLKRYLDDAWALHVGDARFNHDAATRLQMHRLLCNAMLDRWKLLEATADPLQAAADAAPAASLSDRPIDEYYPSLRQKLEHFYGAPLNHLFLDAQGNVMQEASVREVNQASEDSSDDSNDSNPPNPLPHQLLPSELIGVQRRTASKPSLPALPDAQGWRSVPRKKH